MLQFILMAQVLCVVLNTFLAVKYPSPWTITCLVVTVALTLLTAFINASTIRRF
jgi:hypothetical protein